MSTPHLLMLGLIDGGSPGIIVDPPETVGDLGNLSIEAFYVVDYSGNHQKMTKAQYRFIKGVIRIRHAEKLKARQDRLYYNRIERMMNKQIQVKVNELWQKEKKLMQKPTRDYSKTHKMAQTLLTT